MSVVIYPADSPVLSDDAVDHIVYAAAVVGHGYLLINGVLYGIIILGMHHALKAVPGKLTKFLNGIAPVYNACSLVYIKQFHALIRPVDKKTSGHLLCQPLRRRHSLFGGYRVHYVVAYYSVSLHYRLS